MSKASTPKTRLQRTSNPTPPEPESSKKYKIDMSQNNPEMDFNITDLPIPQQFAFGFYCVSNFLNVFIRDSELLWDRKISDIEVHFWIILAHINVVYIFVVNDLLKNVTLQLDKYVLDNEHILSFESY
jgi:hypothetical protein